jgi:DeoR/GlpR family transcriptional regulator of sugar metabolism
MLREERLQIILKMLETNQRVSSVELSEILNVSDDTIRRDLNELAENGLLKKCMVALCLGRHIPIN